MLNEARMGTLSAASSRKFAMLARPVAYNDGIEATELVRFSPRVSSMLLIPFTVSKEIRGGRSESTTIECVDWYHGDVRFKGRSRVSQRGQSNKMTADHLRIVTRQRGQCTTMKLLSSCLISTAKHLPCSSSRLDVRSC